MVCLLKLGHTRGLPATGTGTGTPADTKVLTRKQTRTRHAGTGN